jgi:hypothetical protein
MKQGIIGLIVLLMVGSAWELGRSDGTRGASGLSGPSSFFGGASKLKGLSKKSAKGSPKALVPYGTLFKADKAGTGGESGYADGR